MLELLAGLALLPAQEPPKRLNFVTNAYAAWHPDGKSLVFQSNAAGNYDLYILTLDGRPPRPIVSSSGNDITPVFSPDGKSILFVSERDGHREVYICAADGSEQKNLTNTSGNDIHPFWSTDGKKILFSSNRGNEDADDFDIYEMNADGSALKQITDGAEVDTYASWSPDGSKIVTRRVLGQNNEVFVMNADGTGAKNLTNAPTYDGWPVWSPDGKRICYASGPAGWPAMPNADIKLYSMNPDGSDKVQFSKPDSGTWIYDTQPSYSFDGKLVVFTRYRPGPVESSDLVVLPAPTSGGSHV